jgi:hypothetical protein
MAREVGHLPPRDEVVMQVELVSQFPLKFSRTCREEKTSSRLLCCYSLALNDAMHRPNDLDSNHISGRAQQCGVSIGCSGRIAATESKLDPPRRYPTAGGRILSPAKRLDRILDAILASTLSALMWAPLGLRSKRPLLV